MKRFLSFLAPVLVAVSLLTVSCKSDKVPANSAEMDAYLAEASYLNHLPDQAPILLSIHPLQLLAKSGFATDDDFAGFRDKLFESVGPVQRMAILAVLQNPSLAGLDPAHPLVLAIDGIEATKKDLKCDVYAVLPLTNRDLFIKSINQAGAGLEADENGKYEMKEDKLAFAILPDAILFFGTIGRVDADYVAKKLDKMAAKSSLYVGSPLAESVLMAGDDLALHFSKEFSPRLMDWVSEQVDDDIVKLLGGNPLEDVSLALQANCVTGKAVLDCHIDGSNPLLDRYLSWVGTPDKDDLRLLPASLDLAGQQAFQNLPDMLDYIQEVLDRSGRFDGINIQDVLQSFGIEKDDLNDIGTLTTGYDFNIAAADDFVLLLKVGKRLASILENKLAGLGLERDPEKDDMLHITGDVYLGFWDEFLVLTTGSLLDFGYGSFLEDEEVLAGAIQGNSTVVDLSLSLGLSGFSHAQILAGYPDGQLNVFTAYPDDNAAKTIFLSIIDYVNTYVFTTEDDEGFDEFYAGDFDGDFDEDFDYLY